jgi:putative spermidine/putrescine transport system substrate-binding protein
MQLNRKLLNLIAISTVSFLVASCATSSVNQTNNGQSKYLGPVGDAESTLNVLAWPGYAEDGTLDPAIDWVTQFEKSTGCDVNVKTFDTSDESVQLMLDGGYDVVSASGDAAWRLINSEAIQPINTVLVPNYVDIFDDLKLRPWNSSQGITYGIAHGRGANLLSYSLADVVPAPDSWAITFEPDSVLAGKIAVYDSPMYIADAALYLMATKPELEITNPYALDQNQFNAIFELLKQQKPLTSQYWSDSITNVSGMKSGLVKAGVSWQVNIDYANVNGLVVAGVKPKEGATGWSNSWMISKDTRSINCSYKWLDWIISPQTNASATEWFGEAPANRKSCELTANKNHCTVFHATNTDGFWKNIYYWNTPVENCLDGRTEVTCVPYAEWAKAWSNFRNS